MEEKNKLNESLIKTKEETEKAIGEIIEQGVQQNNIDVLGKLIDIHKDIENEEYWKNKEENYMRYGRSYSDGSYGDDSYGRRGVKGTGPYSRYRDGGSYGRRGVKGTGRGRYRGEDTLNDMHEEYRNYSDGKDMMNRGSYGAEDETIESLECMLESMVEFVRTLKEDADNQEEIAIIQKYTRKMSEM